jgi:hypothetical protein
LEGRDAWTEANRVVSVWAQEQADAWIIEAVVERAGSEGGAPARFRAGLRAVVFKQGGLALVKPLWLENTDPRPWQLLARWRRDSLLSADRRESHNHGRREGSQGNQCSCHVKLLMGDNPYFCRGEIRHSADDPRFRYLFADLTPR